MHSSYQPPLDSEAIRLGRSNQQQQYQPTAYTARPYSNQPANRSSASVPRSSSASNLLPLSSSLSETQSPTIQMPAIRMPRNSSPPRATSSSRQSPVGHSRRLSPVSASRCPSAYVWLMLVMLLCVATGYKLAQLLLSPSAPLPSAAPDSFLLNFPLQTSQRGLRTASSLSSGGSAVNSADRIAEALNFNKAIRAEATAKDDGNNNANSTPQLLLLTSASSTHPARSTLPLLTPRQAPYLPYRMEESAVPAPFLLSPPTSHHNEERLEVGETMSASLHLPAMLPVVTSPLSHKRLTVHINDEGQVGYSVTVGEVLVLLPAYGETAVNYKPCRFQRGAGGSATVHWRMSKGSSYWRPVPGAERRYYYSEYNRIEVWCEGEACKHCPLRAEMRVYEEGFAFRTFAQPSAEDAAALEKEANVDADERVYAVVESLLQAVLPSDFALQCWANNQEDPYVKHECGALLEPTMTPITVQMFDNPKLTTSPSYRLEQRFLTILQADGPAFMRSMGRAMSNFPNVLELSSKGQAHVAPQEGMLGTVYLDGIGVVTPTAWHVFVFGNSAGELLEHNYLIPLLCPPPSSQLPNMVDTRWIGYGKSLRGRGFDNPNAQQLTQQLMQWAISSNYQIVHFDAGWYGVETNKTETATRVYPEFQPNLDMAVIGQHAKESGAKFTVYVNDLALRETDELVKIYSTWGLHGVKFGFVNTNSPRAMRILHERIIAFASGNLFVNVHDLYRPKGITRTWPHLVTQEGIRGEERKPSAEHHTILPWVRLVQGSADYTPRYLKGSGLLCTRAHQLALPIVLFSPIQSLFWAEPAQAIMDGVRWYYPELIVWTVIPTTWDDTRVLASEIGGYASIARRVGQEWFIGSITNTESTTLHLNLSTLFQPLPGHPRSLLPPPSKGYLVHIYADAYSANVPTVTGGRNGIKVLPRMTFILPPALSSELEVVEVEAGMPVEAAETAQWAAKRADDRRVIWRGFDEQIRADKKHFLQKETDWEVMRTGLVSVDMAPSGGHVMVVQPWL